MAKGIEFIGDEILRRFLESVSPAVAARLKRAMEQVKADAMRQWPVGERSAEGRDANSRKPHSRDLFSVQHTIERSGVRGLQIVSSLTNSAEYWRFIKARKIKGRSALVTFVRTPMRQERDRFRADLPQLVPEALRNG